MVRRLFRPIMTVTTTLAVMAGALLGVGLWRRAGDTTWCGKAIMAGSMLGDDPGEAHSLIDEQRSACTQQRERQRILFGAMWRKDGPAMAQCGFELARLQILADHPEARRAILQPYGINDPDFDGGGLDQQDRFIKACIAKAGR